MNLFKLNTAFTFKAKPLLSLFFVLFLLLVPLIVYHILHPEQFTGLRAINIYGISVLTFFIPIFFFRKNLKVFFYLLTPLALATPLIVFLMIGMHINPNFQLIALLMQTNLAELQESSNGFVFTITFSTIIYLCIYLFSISTFHSVNLPFKKALFISATAFTILVAQGYRILHNKETRVYELLNQYYPASLLSGLAEALNFINANNLNNSNNFAFNAYSKKPLKERQIYVLVIGESSNYSHWQINGYSRATNPLLAKQNDLIVYPKAVAGSYLTWVAVPQIITRAHPDNMNLQFNEKSILSAFMEAGFKTAWLSNQSDKDIFWSGTINLHAKAANYFSFSPTQTPNMDSQEFYDERLLPQLDSLIHNSTENLFVVLHLMGNHWVYSNRYPEKFDYYKPSGYTQNITPPLIKNKQAIINSYDNSVRYTDYVLDSTINILKKSKAIASFLFISDHGEDFFEKENDFSKFHFAPSEATLHIPFVMWTSPRYQKTFAQKSAFLLKNKNRKIGTQNVFYTMLDLADITFPNFDTTLSLAHPKFKERPQKFFQYYENKALPFDLVATSAKQ